jgi:hypothetical protein
MDDKTRNFLREPAPETHAPAVVAAHEDPTPATPPDPAPPGLRTREDVEAEAKHRVAEYRKQYPGDERTDDELMLAPYGGFELANLPESERYSIPARLKRLSHRAKRPKTAPEPA